MKQWNPIFKVCMLVPLALACIVTQAQQKKVVGYVANEEAQVVIDYSKITHLNLSFLNPTDANGTLNFTNWQFNAVPLNTAYITQAHASGVKVLASLAGGSASENAAMQSRYFKLINDANRAAFVQKIVAYLNAFNLDGIDVDLEGPAINADYGKFIVALSKALPAGKLLTAALSHLNGGGNVPDDAMLSYDFLNIMAYDKTGYWNQNNPGQHASKEFAVESLVYWTTRGLTKEKCILGVPFYGHSFGTDKTAFTYAHIVDNFSGAENLDNVSGSGNVIYYNGLPTIQDKTQHVIDQNYGGIMIWNLGQDKPSSNSKSLLRAIDQLLKSAPQNKFSVMIEAENYSNMQGVQTESTNDAGDGLNVSGIDATDWLGYENVNIPETGSYKFEFRVASPAGGKLNLNHTAGATDLGTIDVPATGGWQSWQTISHKVNLNAGSYNFRIAAPAGGWNINWIRITEASTILNIAAPQHEEAVELFPNPANSGISIKAGDAFIGATIRIVDNSGYVKMTLRYSASDIDVSELTPGFYTVHICKDNKTLVRKIIIQ